MVPSSEATGRAIPTAATDFRGTARSTTAAVAVTGLPRGPPRRSYLLPLIFLVLDEVLLAGRYPLFVPVTVTEMRLPLSFLRSLYA